MHLLEFAHLQLFLVNNNQTSFAGKREDFDSAWQGEIVASREILQNLEREDLVFNRILKT